MSHDLLTATTTVPHPATAFRNPCGEHRAKTQALRYQHRVNVAAPPKLDKERDNVLVVPMVNAYSINNNNNSITTSNNHPSSNNNDDVSFTT